MLTLLVVVGLCLPSLATKPSTESIASYAKYVQIPGAEEVGSETCATCHDAVAKNFGHAFHAQQGVQCENCHGPGSLHVDGGGEISKIVAFSKRTDQSIAISSRAALEAFADS